MNDVLAEPGDHHQYRATPQSHDQQHDGRDGSYHVDDQGTASNGDGPGRSQQAGLGEYVDVRSTAGTVEI